MFWTDRYAAVMPDGRRLVLPLRDFAVAGFIANQGLWGLWWWVGSRRHPRHSRPQRYAPTSATPPIYATAAVCPHHAAWFSQGGMSGAGEGVTFDAGHGSDFSFDMACEVLAAGIKPHTLGAEMHGNNVRVPNTNDGVRNANPFFGVAPLSLTHAMTELLTLGLSLSDIVATVSSNPAAMIRMPDSLGTLQPGRKADVSVLEVLKGKFELQDNSGARVTADEVIVPGFALKAGVRHDSVSPLIPAPIRLAA